jgi:uncharacterized protein YjdB
VKVGPKVTVTALSPSTARLGVGESFTLTANVTPTDTPVSWSIGSTDGVVEIDPSGTSVTVSAKKVGEETITVSAGGIEAVCTVEVTLLRPSVSLKDMFGIKTSDVQGVTDTMFSRLLMSFLNFPPFIRS